MPEHNNDMQPGEQPTAQPPAKPFRLELVILPVCCVAAMWLAQGMEPAVTWNEVMDRLRIENREEFTDLAVFGLLMIAVTAISRVVWSNGNRQQ